MTPQERKLFELALAALRKARRKVLTTEECHAVIMSIKEALAQPDQYAKGNWINAEDVSRNVKALDIALNGEGAASSPLLIDVLGQVQAEARRIGKPVLKALAQPEPPPECPMDSYGDGNVYRGQRSRDSVVKTITLAQPEQCRKEKHENGEYVCNCKAGECPQFAQPEQEPVAWRFQSPTGGWAYAEEPPVGFKYAVEPLYTHPPQSFTYEQVKAHIQVALLSSQPQRTWVGLTDEDCKGMSAGDKAVAMWADRTLKEKNI